MLAFYNYGIDNDTYLKVFEGTGTEFQWFITESNQEEYKKFSINSSLKAMLGIGSYLFFLPKVFSKDFLPVLGQCWSFSLWTFYLY